MSPRSWMDDRAARSAFARKWERATPGEPRLDGFTLRGEPRLGAFTLRREQARAVERILAAFDAFGGALLADPPGTGKTIIALALAAALREAAPRAWAGPPCDASRAPAAGPDALVLAPSSLRDQWERTARRARVAIRFVSLEAMSRGATVTPGRLVIVDEAHHVRTSSTRRYAGVAAACVGARVLLLTATPVVNRPADRDALLALFLGAAAAGLNPESAARCMVRRADGVGAEVNDAGRGAAGVARPRVKRLKPIEAPLGGGPASVADALASLPPPFPAADGAPAVALVRISLAMAWSSSLAALDAALRRRLQRGGALADALAAGRWPTRAVLRRWLVGDDATQLAFSELEPAHGSVPHDALPVLRTHLAAVRSLRASIGPFIAPDAAGRADALRALQREYPRHRVVVFASHAATIHALSASMRADAGVVAITGGRGGAVRAAAGRWSRTDVLRALGPLARPLPTRADDPAQRSAIRVLLATDLLSEGIELQGVGILVHADRTWTPARLEQREGRITRLGTRAITGPVFVTRFRAPAGSASLLRLGARLMRKQKVRARAVAPAEAWEAVKAAIHGWRGAGGECDASKGARVVLDETSPALPGASVMTAFIALARVGGDIRLVAGRRSNDAGGGRSNEPRRSNPGGRWHVSSSPHAVLAVVRVGTPLHKPRADETRRVRAALARWAGRAAEPGLLGPARDARSPLRMRLHEWVDRLLRSTPLALRAQRGAELEALVRAVSAATGAGVERQLTHVLHRANTDDTVEAGLRAIAGTVSRAHPTAPPRSTLVALLVTRSGAPRMAATSPGPPSAWP